MQVKAPRRACKGTTYSNRAKYVALGLGPLMHTVWAPLLPCYPAGPSQVTERNAVVPYVAWATIFRTSDVGKDAWRGSRLRNHQGI